MSYGEAGSQEIAAFGTHKRSQPAAGSVLLGVALGGLCGTGGCTSAERRRRVYKCGSHGAVRLGLTVLCIGRGVESKLIRRTRSNKYIRSSNSYTFLTSRADNQHAVEPHIDRCRYVVSAVRKQEIL